MFYGELDMKKIQLVSPEDQLMLLYGYMGVVAIKYKKLVNYYIFFRREML